MNFSLDTLVKNLSDEDIEYIVEDFGSKNLELLKQKELILMSTWTVSKDLMKKKLPARKYFFSSTKNRKIGNDGKKSDGHRSVKDYFTCEKNWDKFDMKNMGDYCDH